MSAGTIVPSYIDLRFPDGGHTGVRVDWARGIVEIRKRGQNYYFDIAILSAGTVAPAEQTCYNFNS